MEAPEEAALVRRSQGGDREAFEALIRGHARLVWASVYGCVRDPAWTEDVVQETFLKAWESIRDLREVAAFKGWLLSTARRLAWRRAELAGRNDPIPPPAMDVAAVDPEEARDEVQKALQRLPERYRLPVTLHFLNGQSLADVERETGLANGALRGLLARGAEKLRKDLAPWWRTRHE